MADKIWFAGVKQNNTVSFRFFNSEDTVKKVQEKYPDKITGDNVATLTTEGLDMDRLSVLSSVEEFEQAPAERGAHQQRTSEITG